MHQVARQRMITHTLDISRKAYEENEMGSGIFFDMTTALVGEYKLHSSNEMKV